MKIKLNCFQNDIDCRKIGATYILVKLGPNSLNTTASVLKEWDAYVLVRIGLNCFQNLITFIRTIIITYN